jgi:hypothetical protein
VAGRSPPNAAAHNSSPASAKIRSDVSRASRSWIIPARMISSGRYCATTCPSRRRTVAGLPTAANDSAWFTPAMASRGMPSRDPGGGSLPAFPVRSRAKASTCEDRSRSASSSVAAAQAPMATITRGASSHCDGRKVARYASSASSRWPGAKCEAKA